MCNPLSLVTAETSGIERSIQVYFCFNLVRLVVRFFVFCYCVDFVDLVDSEGYRRFYMCVQLLWRYFRFHYGIAFTTVLNTHSERTTTGGARATQGAKIERWYQYSHVRGLSGKKEGVCTWPSRWYMKCWWVVDREFDDLMNFVWIVRRPIPNTNFVFSLCCRSALLREQLM